jgi:hypothetical protein
MTGLHRPLFSLLNLKPYIGWRPKHIPYIQHVQAFNKECCTLQLQMLLHFFSPRSCGMQPRAAGICKSAGGQHGLDQCCTQAWTRWCYRTVSPVPGRLYIKDEASRKAPPLMCILNMMIAKGFELQEWILMKGWPELYVPVAYGHTMDQCLRNWMSICCAYMAVANHVHEFHVILLCLKKALSQTG